MAVTLAHAKEIEERLRAEVVRREQDLIEAETKKAERSVLDRRRARLRDAAEKHAIALDRVEKAARNKARLDKINAGIAKRPMSPAVPTTDAKQEAKRIAKLKKDILKRTRKDITARPDWMQKPVALPPPIEQPKIEEAAAPPIVPPREGLIEGTYTVMPLDRLFGGLVDADPLPTVWTERHVGRRLLDAFATLRCMPERGNPAGFGAMWPAYRHELVELAHQAGAGTLSTGRRFKRRASADEIALMEESLGWVGQFLSAHNAWARIGLLSWADDPDSEPDDDHRPRYQLRIIAEALNAAQEVVR